MWIVTHLLALGAGYAISVYTWPMLRELITKLSPSS